MTIEEQKKAMRSQIRAVCKAIRPEERARLSRAACERFAALPAFMKAKCLLAYMAMPHECDPRELVKAALRMGKRVAFPVSCADHSLKLLIPNAPDAFAAGKYGIMEPDAARSAEIQREALDLIVVPGVAFDAACGRLGQGAGYYDRLLADVNAMKIGLAFPQQIVTRIPAAAHDVPLDGVVTADTVFSR